MEDNVFDKIHEVDLKDTMEESYINYAMSVIASRALPDVRDGLKPVQRRILYSMSELNNTPDKPHRKCARIVGDTMGKYHPHGDSSIYGALVNMAQDWATRYPMVDGHGNFGSVDGDGAAAMRYTEARLSKISMEMLADINKDTVDFAPNFDETEKEPVVMPARYPNLLVNGTSGIAVGMATNIPPHNLGETIDACLHQLRNPECSIEDLIRLMPAPDFPTGGIIFGISDVHQGYRTGRGRVVMRARTHLEEFGRDRVRIIVDEIPYMVNKRVMYEKMHELMREKKIEGIAEMHPYLILMGRLFQVFHDEVFHFVVDLKRMDQSPFFQPFRHTKSSISCISTDLKHTAGTKHPAKHLQYPPLQMPRQHSRTKQVHIRIPVQGREQCTFFVTMRKDIFVYCHLHDL